METIVVDDGSTDDTGDVAREFGAIVVRNEFAQGPASARNRGADVASGHLLFFLDSDVCARSDAIATVTKNFNEDSALDAMMGSYDDDPACPAFLSQYRNLMHAYVHQHGERDASTFWSGCGAIRRDVFLVHGGFDEGYGRPAIEDIELGYRLKRAGCRMILNPQLQVKHLKTWTLWSLVKTDVMDRGIPWTELILRDKCMPSDLNLQLSQRVSVALVYLLVGLCGAIAIVNGSFTLLPMLGILFVMLSRWWGESVNSRQPRVAFTVFYAVVLVIAGFAYAHRMYGLFAVLMVTPVLLVLRHRYHGGDRFAAARRWVGYTYLVVAVALACRSLPNHPLIVCTFVVIVVLSLLNSSFYIFLAATRGPAFMCAAIPFHMLYHFYSGLSFAAGTGKHLWRKSRRPQLHPQPPPRRVL